MCVWRTWGPLAKPSRKAALGQLTTMHPKRAILFENRTVTTATTATALWLWCAHACVLAHPQRRRRFAAQRVVVRVGRSVTAGVAVQTRTRARIQHDARVRAREYKFMDDMSCRDMFVCVVSVGWRPEWLV